MFRKLVVRALAVGMCPVAILCGSAVADAQTVDAFDPGANQIVNAVAVQPDGKIVVGGSFTGLGAVTGTTTRNHIGRLNVDGTVDPGFNPGANGPVLAVAVQPDGKILAGGNFTSVGGGTGLTTMRSHIARFNADGTVDLGFNPGADLNVHVIVVQPDGKILVGGDFEVLGGAGRIALGRLDANGSPDSFNPGASKIPSGAVPIVKTMALQADGKIVVGGYFNGLGGGTGDTTRNYIGRIEANGLLDIGFNPGASSISGVDALAIQSDGMILVGGSFTGLAGGLRQNIGRIDVNGSLDLSFNPGTETQVLTLAVQADGRILAGGYFKWMGDAGGVLKSTRNYIGRLDPNGAVDGTFNPGAGNVVNGVALQPDGAIVVGGLFLTLGDGGGVGIGTPRNRIGRITNPDAGVQTLTLSGGNSVVTWARGGGGPEVSRVTFEKATGSSAFYTPLGTGTRVAGGWELTGLSLPTHGRLFIRARGYYGAGFQNGSGSIVESVLAMGQSTTTGDFDGDGKTDITVYRPSNGNWFTLQSGTSTLHNVGWGISSDVPVHGDFDGDGKADIAVYRPSGGTWYILQSGDLSVFIINWGAANLDVPVPADYDGDGKTDIAIYRPNTGEWFIRQSNTLTTFVIAWGVSTDLPVPADYDGDGKADIAVFRPGTGVWYILQSFDFTVSIHAWGGAGTDLPVSGDYDGDGKADIAIFRPASAEWFIRQSNTLTALIQSWGLSTDIPVPADYDGDGKIDIAVFRPSNGTWYILQSGTFTLATQQWGISTDIPIHRRP